MTLPFMFTPPPNGEVLAQSSASSASSATHTLAAGLLASVEGWSFPLALLRPLEPLFSEAQSLESEKYLAGLHADHFLGAGILPPGGKRLTPLAWISLDLYHHGQNPFAEVRGGCWVPGYPSIGRGRNLLRAAGLADSSGLGSLLAEIGFEGAPGPALYFNFHYDQPEADCARIYVLDASVRRLHGFALPCSALARVTVK